MNNELTRSCGTTRNVDFVNQTSRPSKNFVMQQTNSFSIKFNIMSIFFTTYFLHPHLPHSATISTEDHILSSFRNTLATLWTLNFITRILYKTFTDADFNHIHIHHSGQSDIISHFSILLMYNPLASCQAWY